MFDLVIRNGTVFDGTGAPRRVADVAVQDGRLYYSGVEGPQIWSVGVNADGSFADDARLEIDVTGTPNGNVVTDIVFDGAGVLYLAQRGEIVGSYDYSVFAKQENSSVLRYVWNETERRWSVRAELFAGAPGESRRAPASSRKRAQRSNPLTEPPGGGGSLRRAAIRHQDDGRPRARRPNPGALPPPLGQP